MKEIIIRRENSLDPAEFINVLIKSTLADRRPVDDSERIKMMCKNTNLIITTRLNGKMIGVARSITDFAYCTYLSDLAVDLEYQNRGIGRKLITETKRAAPKAKLILLSAPAAVNYYPKIGMNKHSHCYVLDDLKDFSFD